MSRVKICGLMRREDAELALEFGADALGFVFEPSSPRYVGDIPDIVRFVGSAVPFAFCVAVYRSVGSLHSGFQAVQFEQECESPRVSGVLPAGIMTLRFEPGTRPDMAVDAARVHLRNRRTFPTRAIRIETQGRDQFGGAGFPADWDFEAEFVANCPVPVILAGGLNPENVADAIRMVRPYAVDVSSGVEERPGVKSAAMMRDFIQAARDSNKSLNH